MKLRTAKFVPFAVSAALLCSCGGDDGDPSIVVDDDAIQDDDDGAGDPGQDPGSVEPEPGQMPDGGPPEMPGPVMTGDADAPTSDAEAPPADADVPASDAEAPPAAAPDSGNSDGGMTTVCGKPVLTPVLDDLEGFNPGDNPAMIDTWNRGDVITIVTTAAVIDSLDGHDGGLEDAGSDAGAPMTTDASAPMTTDASAQVGTDGGAQVGTDGGAQVGTDGGAQVGTDAAAPFLVTPQANSGDQSIQFFDDDETETPEIRGPVAAGTRGVFQASVYISPEETNRRDTIFTVYGNDTSDAARLGSFRLRSDGSIDHRITVAGSNTWMDVASDVFAPETWVEVELAWDSSAGCNMVWLSIDGVEVASFPTFLNEPAMTVGIRVGDNSGTDTQAATFVDDIGFITE